MPDMDASPRVAGLAAGERASAGFIVLLAAVTAAGPVALQIFLPALPLVQQSLHTTPGVAQLALSLSMVAMALATLAYGPLSDRYGRRPVMLGGLAILVLGSLMCAVAPTIEALIAGRLVQAAGGAVGMVLSRAIARDRFGAFGAARVISQLTLVMVAAPMVAPAVGGVLTDTFDWRATFVAVLLFGLVLMALTWRSLPESLPAAQAGGGTAAAGGGAAASASALASMLEPFRAMPTLLRSRTFSMIVLQTAFTSTIFFSFISGAPYVMAHMLQRPPSEYGFYFVLVSGGFMVGNLLSLRYAHRVSPRRLLTIGALVALAGPVLLSLVVALDRLTPLLLFLPMFFGSIGSGAVMPNAQAAAINVFPERAGSASGITGFLQLVFAAGASQLVGVFTGDSAWPMLTCMLIAGVGALACLLLQPQPADPAPLGPAAPARDDARMREDAGAIAPTDNARARNG